MTDSDRAGMPADVRAAFERHDAYACGDDEGIEHVDDDQLEHVDDDQLEHVDDDQLEHVDDDQLEHVDGDRFEHVDEDDWFALDSTAFAVAVTATPTDDGRAGTFVVSMTVPTLSASVADPSDVAPVVEDGWFETFERRLADAFDVAKTSDGDDPVLERGETEVEITFRFASWDAGDGVADAKALAEYVEGTFVQGLIPGYDYVGAAAALRGAAAANAGSESDSDSDSDRTGTPL